MGRTFNVQQRSASRVRILSLSFYLSVIPRHSAQTSHTSRRAHTGRSRLNGAHAYTIVTISAIAIPISEAPRPLSRSVLARPPSHSHSHSRTRSRSPLRTLTIRYSYLALARSQGASVPLRQHRGHENVEGGTARSTLVLRAKLRDRESPPPIPDLSPAAARTRSHAPFMSNVLDIQCTAHTSGVTMVREARSRRCGVARTYARAQRELATFERANHYGRIVESIDRGGASSSEMEGPMENYILRLSCLR